MCWRALRNRLPLLPPKSATATPADNFAEIRKVLNEDLGKVAAKLSPLAAKG